MRTTRLCLICSGITDAMRRGAFPQDEPLEARSIQLAADLRARLPARIDRALCGPSKRARATAGLLGLTADITEAARDQDYGNWAGRTLADLETERPGSMQAWTSDPHFSPTGGESVRDLHNRAAAFLEHFAATPGTTIVVTHGSLVRAIVLLVLEAPTQSFWRIDMPPLSRIDLSFDGRRWALRMGLAS